MIDLSEIFLIKPSEFYFFYLIITYAKKYVENCRNFYDSKKRIISKISKIYISHFFSTILQYQSYCLREASDVSRFVIMRLKYESN